MTDDIVPDLVPPDFTPEARNRAAEIAALVRRTVPLINRTIVKEEEPGGVADIQIRQTPR